jgi:hypothetical protein
MKLQIFLTFLWICVIDKVYDNEIEKELQGHNKLDT